MSLGSLPAEVLSLVAEGILGQELGQLLLTGNHNLLAKLASSQGVKNFRCEVLPQFGLGWPYLIAQFTHLESFCFTIGAYGHPIRSNTPPFDELPQNLRSIELNAWTFADDFLRYLIEHPESFRHLESLSVQCKVHFEEVLRSRPERLNKLQMLKASFQELSVADLPPTLTSLIADCRKFPSTSTAGFHEGLKVLKLFGPIQLPVSLLPSTLEEYHLDNLASAPDWLKADDVLLLPRGIKSLDVRFDPTHESFANLPPNLTTLNGSFQNISINLLPHLPRTLTKIKYLTPELSTRALEALPPGLSLINGTNGPSIKPSDAATRPLTRFRLRLGLPPFDLASNLNTLVLDAYDPSQLHKLPSSLTRLILTRAAIEDLACFDRPDMKLVHLAIPLSCSFEPRSSPSSLQDSSEATELTPSGPSTPRRRNPYAVFQHLEFLLLGAEEIPLPLFKSFGPHLNHIRLRVRTLPFGAFALLPPTLHKIELIFENSPPQGLLHNLLTTLPKFNYSFVCHLTEEPHSDLTISAFVALPRSLFRLTLPSSPHIEEKDFASINFPFGMSFSWGHRQIAVPGPKTDTSPRTSSSKGKCIVM